MPFPSSKSTKSQLNFGVDIENFADNRLKIKVVKYSDGGSTEVFIKHVSESAGFFVCIVDGQPH